MLIHKYQQLMYWDIKREVQINIEELVEHLFKRTSSVYKRKFFNFVRGDLNMGPLRTAIQDFHRIRFKSRAPLL